VKLNKTDAIETFKKDKLAPPFDTYLAEDSIGQQSDNIEHHL